MSDPREGIDASSAGLAGLGREEGFVGPRTPLEYGIAAIWREVFGAVRISVDRNFFDLGGHSLAAAQVVSRIHDEYRVEIPLSRFFAAPTVAKLAESIEDTVAKQNMERARSGGVESTEVELSSQEPEELLSKLVWLTENELDTLLERYQRQDESSRPGAGMSNGGTTKGPDAASGDADAANQIGVEGDLEQLLVRLDELSDEQVAYLLDDLLAAEGK